MLRLQTREARKKLARRAAPYWLELRRGLAVGYRRGTEAGSWLLREFRGGRYVKRRMGLADDELPADGLAVFSWHQVQQRALGTDRPTATGPGRLTVAQAAESYFASRSSAGSHDRITYEAFIVKPLGPQIVGELTTPQLRGWLSDQVGQQPDKDAERRAKATANRRWTLLRAILNAAFRDQPDAVPTDAAWRRVKPFANVDRPRLRNLTADEARALLSALPNPWKPLAEGALLTGCRLGELLALRPEDVRGGRAHIRHSKSGRERFVPLNKEGVALFSRLAKGNAEGVPLFGLEDDGRGFRVHLSRAMRAACEAAKVKPATFHDLRRSYGSLLLNAGASIDHIRVALGHADSRMTQRTYAHLMQSTLADTINQNLPSFRAKRNKP